ncbi:hypothetical protein GY45DRAFT_1365248 [Cubamyces sp. BRFM 1775]|nr:hypothetical protein GY45DRAFT_1365248 [Cubamyces sp. BRFM 1775]
MLRTLELLLSFQDDSLRLLRTLRTYKGQRLPPRSSSCHNTGNNIRLHYTCTRMQDSVSVTELQATLATLALSSPEDSTPHAEPTPTTLSLASDDDADDNTSIADDDAAETAFMDGRSCTVPTTPPPSRAPSPPPPEHSLATLPIPVLRLIFANLHHTDALVLTRTCRALREWRRVALTTLRFPAGRGHDGYTDYLLAMISRCRQFLEGEVGIVRGAVRNIHIYDADGDEEIWNMRPPPPVDDEQEEDEELQVGLIEDAPQSDEEQDEHNEIQEETLQHQEQVMTGGDDEGADVDAGPEQADDDVEDTAVGMVDPEALDADPVAAFQPFPPISESTLPMDPPSPFYVHIIYALDRELSRLLATCPMANSLVIDARTTGPQRAWLLPWTFFSLRSHWSLYDLALLNVNVSWNAYLSPDGDAMRRWTTSRPFRKVVVRGGETPYHKATPPPAPDSSLVPRAIRDNIETPFRRRQREREAQIRHEMLQFKLSQRLQDDTADTPPEPAHRLAITNGELGTDIVPHQAHRKTRVKHYPVLDAAEVSEARSVSHDQAYVRAILEDLERDPAQRGKRIEWAAGLLHNGQWMELLDLEETFAGAWPGQPEDGGSGGGGWVRRVEAMNRTSWMSLRVVSIRTEERLMQFYEELMLAGTSEGAWESVQAFSLDIKQCSSKSWEVLAEILPRMKLRRLRLVVYPGDELWKSAVSLGGAAGQLLRRLSYLEELILDCPSNMLEECVLPATMNELAAIAALPTQLTALTLSYAFVVSALVHEVPIFVNAATQTEDAEDLPDRYDDTHLDETSEYNDTDSGYASDSDNMSDAQESAEYPEHAAGPSSESSVIKAQLESFVQGFFSSLPSHATIRELICIPHQGFWSSCQVQVYQSGRAEIQEKTYKRFWEHDWVDWEWPTRVQVPNDTSGVTRVAK